MRGSEGNTSVLFIPWLKIIWLRSFYDDNSVFTTIDHRIIFSPESGRIPCQSELKFQFELERWSTYTDISTKDNEHELFWTNIPQMHK